ncbi:DUF1176 domain-containing protein [Pseudoduganella violaceinigra]|uniref:DUF1176 domain-containing protein n=1 Tax=Pseudoduganella violaceinigra TaxID=246602 RepID=UPI0004282B88|nr:DUF1176 domain-containing protein [Pseudoduganella violaceinigra]
MRTFLALVTAVFPLFAAAFSPTGLQFSRNQWELACDNTGTCRAAGYGGGDGGEHGVSVLLTRAAGPGQPVRATVRLAKYGEDAVVDTLPAKFSLELSINGQELGTLAFDREAPTTELSQQQVNALLAALPGNAEIEMSLGDHVWQLSDQGAAAVLLKMDEYQGRLGTIGALVRKGKNPETNVPPGVPVPSFTPAPIPKAQAGDAGFAARHEKALMKALRASTTQEDCEELFDEREVTALTAVRLSPSKMLAHIACWRAAYNAGGGYWIVNDRPPFQPVLVTTSGTDSDTATIREQHKGRGLGDCWSSITRGWNGKSFEIIEQSTTGMCRLIAPGGPWSLPTVVTKGR